LAVPGTGVLLAGRYRLGEQIAVGGTGQVWRGTDTVLGRAVAVKLLRPEYAGHAETLARFRAEARHAAQLAHPGIVQVYDYGLDGPEGVYGLDGPEGVYGLDGPEGVYGLDGPEGVPFLVMELVDGPSLADVAARGPLDPSWVLDIIAQVAGALAAAHATGLVHRDIKPANLLLAPDGTLKITDFGIAYAAGSAPLTRTGTLPGTPGYLAPERALGGSASPASDLYSLGVVAWECLAGAPPFTGTPLEIASAHAHRDLPPLPATVPAGVAGLVAELTAKEQAARPPSAAAVAVRAWELRGTVAACAATSPGRPAGAERGAPPPVTLALAGITVRDAPLFRRRLRRVSSPRRTGRAPVLAVAGVIAAAGLTAGLLAATSGTAPQPTRPNAGTAGAAGAVPASPAGRMVTIDSAALKGQPADTVVGQLRHAGLRPRLVRAPDGHRKPGTVISVQPTGQVPVGTAVTVTAAAAPPGHGHGHGNGGGGNGGGGNSD
jgi:eukaryotic-like serine/threonine-protein kinase